MFRVSVRACVFQQMSVTLSLSAYDNIQYPIANTNTNVVSLEFEQNFKGNRKPFSSVVPGQSLRS
jgi:hypothetical protein